MMGRVLASILTGLFLASSASAAPITVEFRGVVGDGSSLSLILPDVAATDSVHLRFTYDDEAMDATFRSVQIGGPIIDIFPDRGIYPASGAPFGAEVRIGSYELSSDNVLVSIINDGSGGDWLSFRSEVEFDGALSAYAVSLRDPAGLLISSDEITPLPALQAFPGRRTFSVTGTGGQFVWGYHRDRVLVVPEPMLLWLLGCSGLAAIGRRR